jgi:hypothetical protein
LVFLKLQPYIQNSVVVRSNQKLAYKYYGPYSVLARVGKVAYRLELPATNCIHPIIHVSHLKKVIGMYRYNLNCLLLTLVCRYPSKYSSDE